MREVKPSVTTSFIIWDGDPAVFVKEGAMAKAIRFDFAGAWVEVHPSAIWFDEARNTTKCTEAEFKAAVTPAAFDDAMQMIGRLGLKPLQRPAKEDRERWDA